MNYIQNLKALQAYVKLIKIVTFACILYASHHFLLSSITSVVTLYFRTSVIGLQIT